MSDTIPPIYSDALDNDSGKIHPLAVAVGVLMLLLLVIVVTTTSYQRERLQYMARRLIRKRITSGKPMKQDNDIINAKSLPEFARLAAESGSTRVVRRWVNSTNRDINGRSPENLTALHYACRGGHNDCTRMILIAGADPNVHDDQKLTPLHLAAVSGHALCLKLLLEYHADPFRTDVDLRTPLKLAEQSGNIGCSRLLQRAMARITVDKNGGGSKDQDAALSLRVGSARIEKAV